MGRPREFCQDEVLEKATELFWTRGYQRTTLQNLLDAMELSKSSFYESFQSKRQLYLKCLQHYIDEAVVNLRSTFANNDLHSGLEIMYEGIVDAATKSNPRCGCMISNTATELSPHDREAEAMVKKGLRRIEEVLFEKLKQSQNEGTLSTEHDPRSLARFFVSSNSGLHVISRANLDRKALNGIVKIILKSAI